MCQIRITFFDSYIWTFYSDLKRNSHKEKKGELYGHLFSSYKEKIWF